MPNNCWDDQRLQQVLDTIHAEIKEFDFSKTWHGSMRVYETLKFHLHRMYGYAPFDIKQSPEQLKAGLISVQFSGPAEPKLNEAEMQAPLRDLTQRPRDHVDVYNWDEYTTIAHVADKIRRELESKNCSAVYYGSYGRLQELETYLALYNIAALNMQACNDTEVQAIFRRQHKASSISSANTESLTAVSAEAVSAEAVSAEAVSAEAVQHISQQENRCHRPGLDNQSKFWHRKGQYSVRIMSVVSISPISECSFTVFLQHKMHITMKFISDKAARAARCSLAKAVSTGRP